MVRDEQDEVPLNGELKAQAQADPVEVVPGLWSWAARHPEWHPGEFGAEVVSFGVRAGEDSLLIDPLLPEGAGGGPAGDWRDIGFLLRQLELLAREPRLLPPPDEHVH